MAISQKTRDFITSTFTALTFPIMILNLTGGIISGIWLAFLGDWREIFTGIVLMIISGWGISLALMPSLLFSAPAMIAIEKGKKIVGIVFGSLSVLYTVALMTAWSFLILIFFTGSATHSSLVPLLIWSYGAALGPWMWLAQKDNGNEYSIFTVLFGQISYIIAIAMFLLGATHEKILLTFGIVMLIGAIFQIFIAFSADN